MRIGLRVVHGLYTGPYKGDAVYVPHIPYTTQGPIHRNPQGGMGTTLRAHVGAALHQKICKNSRPSALMNEGVLRMFRLLGGGDITHMVGDPRPPQPVLTLSRMKFRMMQGCRC